ncbi:unnamed protein product [Prorocentrum cordatum]|uniref:Uncharacterized protein n=1 Tax=Prorocentrum cordatum TaxID=2364126 RepID=A0ABN9QJ44_9DINO|nr:unnamed protein product [Polarella glacialis]
MAGPGQRGPCRFGPISSEPACVEFLEKPKLHQDAEAMTVDPDDEVGWLALLDRMFKAAEEKQWQLNDPDYDRPAADDDEVCDMQSIAELADMLEQMHRADEMREQQRQRRCDAERKGYDILKVFGAMGDGAVCCQYYIKRINKHLKKEDTHGPMRPPLPATKAAMSNGREGAAAAKFRTEDRMAVLFKGKLEQMPEPIGVATAVKFKRELEHASEPIEQTPASSSAAASSSTAIALPAGQSLKAAADPTCYGCAV